MTNLINTVLSPSMQDRFATLDLRLEALKNADMPELLGRELIPLFSSVLALYETWVLHTIALLTEEDLQASRLYLKTHINRFVVMEAMFDIASGVNDIADASDLHYVSKQLTQTDVALFGRTVALFDPMVEVISQRALVLRGLSSALVMLIALDHLYGERLERDLRRPLWAKWMLFRNRRSIDTWESRYTRPTFCAADVLRKHSPFVEPCVKLANLYFKFSKRIDALDRKAETTFGMNVAAIRLNAMNRDTAPVANPT